MDVQMYGIDTKFTMGPITYCFSFPNTHTKRNRDERYWSHNAHGWFAQPALICPPWSRFLHPHQPHYTPPRPLQVFNGKAGMPSDVFSFGVLSWHLATGSCLTRSSAPSPSCWWLHGGSWNLSGTPLFSSRCGSALLTQRQQPHP
ncbi:hypothetical protein Vretimale_14284 [Volvox reticuliferus]|uniref:Protein kinase domain-containing protein n=1 Tax=Volvox reticuliferus TaxID=1737510 RepID=A0A8J4GM03_9CHLO|nr:hypothetical protein Vretifemale_15282 [Volvox reticuliferus]GIM10710.1 hypothetical protein Vretimale_14284 [Volvox reticuliferus]